MENVLQVSNSGRQQTYPASGITEEIPASRLTPTEKQIVAHVAHGDSNRKIGKMLGTSEGVIKNNLRNIFDKTGMNSRLELALWALDHPEIFPENQ